MRKSALTLAVALSSAAAAVPSRPAPGPTGLRPSSIGLDVKVDYEEELLSGTARIELENTGANRAAEASLLLNRLMVFHEVRAAGGRRIPFRQAVVTFADSPKQQVTRAVVRLDPPLAPGGRRTIVVTYSGYLTGYTETGSLYIQDRIERDFTILRSDAYAFPVVGVPSWRANKEVPLGDFPFDVSVTVPDGLTVANGGELVEKRSAGGATTFRYASRAPAPFLNIAIAPYEMLEREGVRLFVFPKDRGDAERVLAGAHRAIALFGRWLGPPSERPRFALIEIPEGWGSQASLSGGIIQTADVFRPGASLEPLYHEISHFWNPPDRERLSPRWNEGLASYLQRRARKELDAWTGFGADLDARAARLRERAREEPKLASVPPSDFGKEGLTDWSYPVGMLMFSLLDRVLGEAAFDRVLGGFYQEHRHSGATSRDLLRYLKEHGGEPAQRVLEDWFLSTRWSTRLGAGESLEGLAASYREAGR